MIPISDFQRRSLTGPVMKEQEFDMTFAKKVREIVGRYPIKYNGEEIFADETQTNAIFEAGIDLLAEVGLYNRSTQRVIQFTRDEVVQIAKDTWNGSGELTFGKGKDEVTIKRRTPDDPMPPVYFMGAPGTTSTEELYIPYVQSFMQEELAQGNHGVPTLTSYQGIENRAGAPGEIVCSNAEISMAQEAARRAGKPDMYIGVSSASSVGGVMALCRPGVLERYNTMIPIHIMPEQKLDWDRLSLALCCEQRGMIPWSSASSIIGALCRGPVDSSVTLVANLLGQLGYGHGPLGFLVAVNLDGSHSSRDAIWATTTAAMALNAHVGIPLVGGASGKFGAGTELAFYEKAALTVAQVASGAAYIWYESCRCGRGDNPTSGLEGRLRGETSIAVAGMKTAEANELVKKILAKYEDQLVTAPEGKTFSELYDVKKVQPTAEYMAVYQRAKEELARLGVPYKK